MALSITTTIPFRKDKYGVMRTGNTRVTFDTVIIAFKNGSTSEEIAYQFPSLDLADVYAAIGYYLRNRADVETYLAGRQKKPGKFKSNMNLVTTHKRFMNVCRSGVKKRY